MSKDIYTDCVNGELRSGDLVISTPDDMYACLVGRVLEINKLGTPEHENETDNDTDDVHVDFYSDYSPKRIAEIEALFSGLYDEKKAYDECPIDDTIMPPESLIRITGIEDEQLAELLESHDKAAAFCENALRVRELTDRLDRNLRDYHDSLLLLDKEKIIGEAGTISAMSDTHYYLTANHEFTDSETEYLLLFQNPLEVVADKWGERVGQMDDFTFALDEVFGKKAALHGGYPLYEEPKPPGPFTGEPADLREAARREAGRLLYELNKLSKPNHPDGTQYMAKISREYINMAGFSYDIELFRAFHPPLPMTFGGMEKHDGDYISMTGGVRANVKVVQPSLMKQLREASEKAAKQAVNPARDHKRDGPAL
jgi:hypothetical protein